MRYSLGGDFFTLEPGVDGSVPTVDAPLSDENERVIRVTNGPKLNARIAAIRPTIVNDDLGNVQFRSVETVTSDGVSHKNELYGGLEFTVIGKRLGGEDQVLLFKDADGETLSEATFLGGDELGQQFRYKLPTPPEDATHGKLVLTSRGKDTPEKNPKTITVNVDYLPLPAPTMVVNGATAIRRMRSRAR